MQHYFIFLETYFIVKAYKLCKVHIKIYVSSLYPKLNYDACIFIIYSCLFRVICFIDLYLHRNNISNQEKLAVGYIRYLVFVLLIKLLKNIYLFFTKTKISVLINSYFVSQINYILRVPHTFSILYKNEIFTFN